ncbi:MAG: class I SAM-dependent methyltransferase [Pseudomonadota bacterium]
MNIATQVTAHLTPTHIHPEDFIFQNILKKGRSPIEAVDEYLTDGRASAKFIAGLVAQLRPVAAPLEILEFASGFGRVSRHLKQAFPKDNITACDIHRGAVEFTEHVLGVEAILSTTQPKEFYSAQNFDVIFAISFFTHMPKRTWAEWLGALTRALKPNGLLIFTTHGKPSLPVICRNVVLDDEGYWFSPLSEQTDLDTAEYGTTVTSFNFVQRHCNDLGLHLNRFVEAGAGYQDLFAVTKPITYSANLTASEPMAIDGGTLAIPVKVTNSGSEPWDSGYSIGGRLFGPEGYLVREFRAHLPSIIGPSEKTEVDLMTSLNSLPSGEYSLTIDVVKEGHFWFSDAGSAPTTLTLESGD